MAVDARRVKELFGAALDIPETAARDAYLDRECGDDSELRQRLDALLQAHESPASAVKQPLAGEGTVAYTASEKPGTIVAGRYKLLESIGEGGMGTVWVAEQTEPVKRKVAVKLIKPGMDSKSVLARFEAERQALAMMDHPNIAKVLDGGLTDQGRPYFVMEYVKGVPITEYCDATRLSIHERLNLFIQVCQAVQHAHQKGIIHRDLKPSNILVAPYDDKPVPKIIDFGLAKAMHQSLTERTLHTAHESVLGTPLYMSPEQAQLNNLDVDTRSDIYSLGVLLYELLTGTTPLEKQRFKQAAWDEVRRIIREEEPPRPSSRLSSIDTLPSLAAGRHTDPLQLTRLVKGELDWIVMKALEKDRTRRYETANGFARDIQRYLSDEVVEARPASAGYRLRKLVSRNKGKVLAASLILLALLAGVAGSTWQAVRATRAEQLALGAAEEERKAKQEAEAEKANALKAAEAERLAKLDADARREEAVRNLAFAKKGNELLGSVFAGLNPEKIALSGRPLQDVLRENLVKAVKELDGSAIGDPLEVAAMQNTLGLSLTGLGEAKLAVEVFEKALDTHKTKLGPDHPHTLQNMNNLAVGYRQVGQLDKALPLLEETLKRMKAKLGPDHPHTLQSMINLADVYRQVGELDKALPFHEETLRLTKAKLGPDHPHTLLSMNNLAGGYQDAGLLSKALPLHEETLRLTKAKLGPDHPHTLQSMNNLAVGYRQVGQLDKAKPLLEETLKRMKSKLGSDHPRTLQSMINLGDVYRTAGELDKALPLLEETHQLMKAKLGPDHPHTLLSMDNLAGGYQDAGMLSKALSLHEETLRLTKVKLGPDHPHTLLSMNNLAGGYRQVGQLDKSLSLLEDTLKLKKAKLGPDHPSTLNSMANLATGYRAAGKLDQAIPLYVETLRLTKAKLGPDHPSTLLSINNLAAGYWSLQQLDKSVPLFEELLPIQQNKLGRGHPNTQSTVANLGVNYKDAGRVAEAIPLLEEAYRSSKKLSILRWVEQPLLDAYGKAGKSAEATKLINELLADARKNLPQDSPPLAGQIAQFGMSLLMMKGYAEAEVLLRECLAIREKTQPDAWTTFNTHSMLGAALLGQKKFAEAEPLLLKGYEGLKAREKTIPPQGKIRLPEALERLIQLYTETNKPEEVKKWQGEKMKWSSTEKPARK